MPANDPSVSGACAKFIPVNNFMTAVLQVLFITSAVAAVLLLGMLPVVFYIARKLLELFVRFATKFLAPHLKENENSAEVRSHRICFKLTAVLTNNQPVGGRALRGC